MGRQGWPLMQIAISKRLRHVNRMMWRRAEERGAEKVGRKVHLVATVAEIENVGIYRSKRMRR